jgi:hypothetical protein
MMEQLGYTVNKIKKDKNYAKNFKLLGHCIDVVFCNS